METNYISSRERQKKFFIFVILIFIVAVIITVIFSKTEQKDSKETTILTSTEQSENNSNEIVIDEEQTVTGRNGENNTLIPAIVKRVISSKVLEVSVDGKDIQLAMIGIEVSKEKETDAVKFINEKFKNSKNIWLQYDEMTINTENQNLCYVWLSKDINLNLVSSCQTYMLQAILIEKGIAKPVEEYPNSRYTYALNSINNTE